jgi:DNA-binding CsgD family transcriptional regulator
MSVVRPFFDDVATSRIIHYSLEVGDLATPDEVLDRLHAIVSEKTPICVQGAGRFSPRPGDWKRPEIGKTLFVHKSVPRDWLEEWLAFIKSGYPSGLMVARLSLAPFTWTELRRMLDPVGVDRLPFELALKHGMRDGYLCPVGGRWVVGFWSSKPLHDDFTQQARGLLNLAANAAAARLEKLACDNAKRIGLHPNLTPRELAVLRHASMGETFRETAGSLGLGEETVRSHFKKAQAKLGTRNRTQTVAEAIRQLLIV